MNRRKDRIRFKMLPNGNIRGFQNRGGEGRSVGGAVHQTE